MKKSLSNLISVRTRQEAQVKVGLVVAVFIFTLLGVGGFQYYRHARTQSEPTPNAVPTLLPGSRAVLDALKSPIEIRFYSLLDSASTPESLRAFAERVNQLLAEYEREGKGKVHIVRFEEMNDDNAKAAAADGVHSFNREKGEACYLGIAAVRDGQKETMAELSPDWEQALESDLSRVVGRVNEMAPSGATAANVSATEMAAAQKAIESNPALASASPDQAEQLLREQALAEFKAAVTEMQNQTRAAEQRLAQGSTSQAEIAGEIQKIQAAQTAKMQEITARLHNQIAALTQNKNASR